MTTDLGHLTIRGPFTLRPIAHDDAAEIASMAAELSQHEGAPAPLLVAEDIERELARPDCVLQGYMVEQNARVVGYALFTISYDTESGARGAYMCDLYVRPQARRNGLGRRLMAAIARETAAQGGTWIAWGALASNKEAQQFYAKLGRPEEGVQLWSLSNQGFAQLKLE